MSKKKTQSIVDTLLALKSRFNAALQEKNWEEINTIYTLFFSTDKVDTEKQPETVPIINPDFTVAQPIEHGRRPVRAQNVNKFDSMLDIHNEAHMETGYSQINDNVKPTARNRNPYKEQTVQCTTCGKTYNVNPLFSRANYVCTTCLRNRK